MLIRVVEAASPHGKHPSSPPHHRLLRSAPILLHLFNFWVFFRLPAGRGSPRCRGSGAGWEMLLPWQRASRGSLPTGFALFFAFLGEKISPAALLNHPSPSAARQRATRVGHRKYSLVWVWKEAASRRVMEKPNGNPNLPKLAQTWAPKPAARPRPDGENPTGFVRAPKKLMARRKKEARGWRKLPYFFKNQLKSTKN